MRETSEEIRYFTIKLDSELRPTLKKIKLN